MSAIYVNLELKVLNAIVFRRVRFRCPGVFRWCSAGVTLVFRGVPLVFRGIPLFRHYSGVFRCSAGVPRSVVPCSGVPGFMVCRGDGSLQHAIEGVINVVESIIIGSKKQKSILIFFIVKCFL